MPVILNGHTMPAAVAKIGGSHDNDAVSIENAGLSCVPRSHLIRQPLRMIQRPAPAQLSGNNSYSHAGLVPQRHCDITECGPIINGPRWNPQILYFSDPGSMEPGVEPRFSNELATDF